MVPWVSLNTVPVTRCNYTRGCMGMGCAGSGAGSGTVWENPTLGLLALNPSVKTASLVCRRFACQKIGFL